jgi:hypothetical protein
MAQTVDLTFRIDTDSLLARFWADLAFTALGALGEHGAKGAEAMRERLDEIGYFNRTDGTVSEKDKAAARKFEDGWDSVQSLFDGRFSRQQPDG